MTAIGILSVAHLHAASYAAALAEHDDAEFVGVTDEDPDRGRAFADDHATAYLDTDDLLDAADGVVVCSTNADHSEWATRAAEAGVDVLCEKPLAPTVAEAELIAETCEESGVGLGVAMPLRFSPAAREANERLAAGDLGDLQGITGTNRGQMPGGWFVDPEQSGGGVVIDHTVHIVDLVHWITGERVAEVYAETASRLHDIGVEDVNVLSMELSDGTHFSLDGSWSRPDQWDHWGDATLELVGDEGVLSVDCFDQTFKHTQDSDGGIQTVYWGSDADAGLIADFVASVDGDGSPEISGSEGVDAVRVVEAAYESAEKGAPVDVEY